MNEESILNRATANIAKVQWADDLIQRQLSPSDNVTFVSLTAELCVLDQCISIVNEENIEPIAWDYAHLTKSGSIFIAKTILSEQ